MLQMVPRLSVLNYVVLIIMQLKLMWDYLLYRPFFHSDAILVPKFVENLNVITNHNGVNDSELDEECAFCLCKIDEGDELRELRCHHLFHRVCLDRWLGCGHVTCPLCRRNLRQPQPPEIHQEIILINFCSANTRYNDRSSWWLR